MYPSLLGSFYVSGKLPQRPLCVLGRLARRKKRKRAGDDGTEKERKRGPLFPSSHRPTRAIYFSIIVIFIGIPSGSLCAGERKYAGFGIISLENVRREEAGKTFAFRLPTKCPCRVSEVDLDPSRSENEHLWVVHF